MAGSFETRIVEPHAAHDTRLLGDFSAIYCRGVHRDADRRPLMSAAAALGVYARKTPVVCDECAELLRYAEKRRAFCPKDPKPFCSNCDTHCYTGEMAERMRVVMRYAGPRSLLHGHALDGIKHALEVRRAKRSQAAPASPPETTDERTPE
jgi:hypothetical protein